MTLNFQSFFFFFPSSINLVSPLYSRLIPPFSNLIQTNLLSWPHFLFSKLFHSILHLYDRLSIFFPISQLKTNRKIWDSSMNSLTTYFNGSGNSIHSTIKVNTESESCPLCSPPTWVLNQIPYDYTVEVRNRFKGLDLIDRLPDELTSLIPKAI